MAQRTCQWRSRYAAEKCGRQAYDQREYCIFHIPDKTDDEAVEFKRAIRDDIAEQLKEHPGDVDFGGFHFPDGIDIAEMLHIELADARPTIKEGLSFAESFFHGLLGCHHVVLKSMVIFTDATFQGDAWFDGATFQGNAAFHEARFKGSAWFNVATFKEDAWFNGATFQRETNFHSATFQGDAEFRDVTLARRSDFNQVKFAKTLRLRPRPCEDAQSAILLSRTRFGRSAELDFSEFLVPATSPMLVVLRECVFGREAVATVRGAMGCVSLFHADLSRVAFLDEDWHSRSTLGSVKPRPRRAVVEEYVLEKKAKGHEDIPPYLQDVNVDGVAQLYRRLRDNYEGTRRYAEAGDFFIGEMEILRQYRTVHAREDKAPSQQAGAPVVARRPLSDPYRLLLLEPYRILGQYGESIRRPAVAALILILLFTVVRPPLPSVILSAAPFLQSPAVVAGANPPPNATEILNATWGAFLESVFAFFQLRAEGNVSLLERLLSVPILGLLFIAIRRKLERR